MASYLERYKDGEQKRVWDELVALGDAVREEPLREDAWAVACETMRRVRFNVELLIPRLTALGWTFRREPLTPPGDGPAVSAAMEAICEPLPLASKAFYEIVGGINLTGVNLEWDDFYDPLVVGSGTEVLQDLHDQQRWYEEEARKGLPATPFVLYYAPDPLAKEGLSSVGSNYITAPFPAADAMLCFEGGPIDVMFVQSLRNAFRWGGFQGLVTPGSGYEADNPPPPTDLAALAVGFLPL